MAIAHILSKSRLQEEIREFYKFYASIHLKYPAKVKSNAEIHFNHLWDLACQLFYAIT